MNTKIFKRLTGSIIVFALVLGTIVIPTKSQAATATLLNTYGSLLGHSGTCINSWQLNNSSILSHVKSQYNSITLENEMKPDSILGYSPNLISKSDAEKQGYYVPSSCTETYLPKLNFSTVDSVMKKCYENGLGMRAHTLLWHAQTPAWFFRVGYSTNYGYVSQSVMDARMEYYIKSVINHVYSSPYGSVVYAWDVVNEYLHASNSGWEAVYGKGGTSPAFIKRAFRYAYECIDYFGLKNKVSLFYNDFNTYMEVNDVIALVNYINSSGKICNGVGMQSHVGTTFPSVDYYTSALRAFVNAGFEVQITELDIANKKNNIDQANYVYQLMKNIISIKKSGGNITGLTFWGLSDDVSWVNDDTPLLFSTLGNAKYAYYRALDAYTDSGLSVGGGSSGGSNNSGNTVNNNYQTLNNGWYYIKNTNSNKYLQVANNTGANSTNVEIATGRGAHAQRWYLTNVGNGYVTLKNGLGYMLDVQYGENNDGANIQTYSDNGADAQRFKVVKTNTNGVYGITTKVSKDARALDVNNFGQSDGTNVLQWSYKATSNQTWTFESINDGTINNGWYYIKNVNSNKYLQVENNSTSENANVCIGSGNGSNGQKWYVENDGNGYVTLKNRNSYMLDIYYGNNEDGTNIQVHSANGADAQKFQIAKTEANNAYGITTKVSNNKRALDVYDWGSYDGCNVIQWSYYSAANQQWIFEPCN